MEEPSSSGNLGKFSRSCEFANAFVDTNNGLRQSLCPVTISVSKVFIEGIHYRSPFRNKRYIFSLFLLLLRRVPSGIMKVLAIHLIQRRLSSSSTCVFNPRK